MQHELSARLQHVIAAAEAIARFTEGKTFADYAGDELLRSGVERQFTIIGEALREAEKLDPTISSHITAFRRIVDFRNILVHGYATVYDEGVWLIVQQHLPVLLSEARLLAGPSPA